MRTKATDRDVSAIRAAMHDAVNRICDRWPVIEAMRQGHEGWPARTGENVGGHTEGSHSDPTADLAVNQQETTRQRDWLISRAQAVAMLNRVDAAGSRLLPTLPPRVCHECQQTIEARPHRQVAGRPGLWVHESCRMRSRRAAA